MKSIKLTQREILRGVLWVIKLKHVAFNIYVFINIAPEISFRINIRAHVILSFKIYHFMKISHPKNVV